MDKQEILATFGTKDTRQRQSKQNKKQTQKIKKMRNTCVYRCIHDFIYQ